MTGENPFQATEAAATFKPGEKPKFLHVAEPQSGPMILTGDNPFQSTGSAATFKSGEKPKFLHVAEPQPGQEQRQQRQRDLPKDDTISNGRPGDWICPKCSKNNFARNTNCFRCKLPKDADPTKQVEADQQQNDESWKNIPNGRPGDWLCPKCSNHNFSRNANCFRCKTPKDAPKQVEAENDESWKNIPNGRPGDWLCPKCDIHNFSKNKDNCFKCKAPRNQEKKNNEPIIPGSYRDYLLRKERGEGQEPPPWDPSGVASPSEVPEVVNDEVPPTPAQGKY